MTERRSGPGKRPTITGIAREAGVSKAAVSYALNGQPGVSVETRDRILVVAERLGWRPNIAARSLSVARAHAIGLLIARPAELLGIEPFFMRLIAGLERELAATGSALLLQFTDGHRAWNGTVERWWAEHRVDGVVVTDLYREDARVPVLARLGIPAVIAGRPQPELDAPAVWNDDGTGVRLAVEHLVALGHRRIARVAGLPGLDHTQARTEAFAAAVEGHGLPVGAVLHTDYSFEAGTEATATLLSGDRCPTAILYDNDLMALAGVNVARERGVDVPGALSIVAGDDSPLCLLGHPPVTAVSRDVVEYGATVARTLLQEISGLHPGLVRAADPVLAVRASTGPPSG